MSRSVGQCRFIHQFMELSVLELKHKSVLISLSADIRTKLALQPKMIRSDNQIRLNQNDLDWLVTLTGVIPGAITTIGELNSFVDQHLPMYDDSTPESKLLAMLLADKKINQNK